MTEEQDRAVQLKGDVWYLHRPTEIQLLRALAGFLAVKAKAGYTMEAFNAYPEHGGWAATVLLQSENETEVHGG